MKEQDLNFLIALLEAQTGIRLDKTKSYLLESRLTPVMRDEDIESMEAFCNALRGHDRRRLLPKVVDAMTTNETSFFRDEAPFLHLVKEVIPRLIEARKDRRSLRIWSAASSSGQEAVTLAIVLLDKFPILQNWDVKILATDVSAQMVQRCKDLIFTPGEIGRGMPLSLRDRHFEACPTGWRASDDIRQLIQPQQLNLIEPFQSMEQQDLILLRNVLIYFGESVRDRILDQMSHVLAADGLLLLGTAEKPRCHSFQRAFDVQANLFRRAS